MNCKAEQQHVLLMLNAANTKDIINNLHLLLSNDNDLTENEEFFRSDTLKKGYVSEAERIIKESIEKFSLNNLENIKAVFEEVFSSISNQDFFGECDIQFKQLEQINSLVISYTIGG